MSKFKVGDEFKRIKDPKYTAKIQSVWGEESYDIKIFSNGILVNCPRVYQHGFDREWEKLTKLDKVLS